MPTILPLGVRIPFRLKSLLPNSTTAFLVSDIQLGENTNVSRHVPFVSLLSDCLLHGVVKAQPAGRRNLYNTLVDSVTLMCLHIVPRTESGFTIQK